MVKRTVVRSEGFIVACIVLLTLVTAVTRAAERITVQTQFRLPDAAESQDVQTIWLGGVAREQDVLPQLLGIAWAKDPSSWVPLWSLHAESNADLLRSAVSEQGVQRYNLDKSVALPWGHEIEAIIGYDGEGTVSIWIYNVTADEPIYRGSVVAEQLPADVQPVAGIVTQDNVFHPFEEVTALAAYVPRSVQWDFVPVVDGNPEIGGISWLTRQDRYIEAVGIRLDVPGRAPGSFRFWLEQEHTVMPLLQVDNASGEMFLPLDMNELLAGHSRLVMEYDDPGVYRFTEATALDVGEVFVGLEELALFEAFADKWHLRGVARVAGDGPLPDLDLDLHYDIRIPGLRAPLHQNWQTVVGTDTVTVRSLRAEPQLVPFEIDIGSLPVDGDKQELFVSVVPGTQSTMRVTHIDGGRFTAGTRTPIFPPVEGYDVVRADLHMHTTLSDGQLFPSDRAWESRVYGYDVISLTDHGTHKAYDFVADFADEIDLVVIRGLETGRMDGEHFVALDVDVDYVPRDSHKWALQPGESTVYYKDQVRDIIDHGGMIIYAHPGGKWLPDPLYDHPEADVGWTDAIEWMLEEGYLHGVDVRGHYGARRRDAPFRWALEHDLTMVDVSDTHEPRDFDAADKAPLTLLFVEEATADGAMDALWEGRTVIWRAGELRGTERWLVPLIETMLEFSIGGADDEPCLHVTSHGGLPLEGILTVDGDGAGRNIAVDAFCTLCVPGISRADTVTVTWLNVFSAPGKSLITTHSVSEK